jgi:hypothetical protein
MKKNLLCSGIALIMIMSCSKKDNEVMTVAAKNQSVLKSVSVDIRWVQCNPTDVKAGSGLPNIDFVYKPPTPPAPQDWSGTATGNSNKSASGAMLKSNNVFKIDTLYIYQLTGNRKYRVSYASISASCYLLSPDGKTMPADTIIECPDKDYFLTLTIHRNDASEASFSIDALSFKVYSAVVTETIQGLTGTIYFNSNCSFNGPQYPMGSSAPSSIYETITANGLNYGDNIPLISVSYGPLTQTCVNGSLEKYTPWTAFYSDAIPLSLKK